MFTGVAFLIECASVAFWSACLMFLAGLLAIGAAHLTRQPIARWVLSAVALLLLICFHGWDVWFQSSPTTWAQHLEARNALSHDQQVYVIWAAFWGGIVGSVAAGVAKEWAWNRTGY